jgi:hypothetical protein
MNNTKNTVLGFCATFPLILILLLLPLLRLVVVVAAVVALAVRMVVEAAIVLWQR